jgi:hypothetical protein
MRSDVDSLVVRLNDEGLAEEWVLRVLQDDAPECARDHFESPFRWLRTETDVGDRFLPLWETEDTVYGWDGALGCFSWISYETPQAPLATYDTLGAMLDGYMKTLFECGVGATQGRCIARFVLGAESDWDRINPGS